MLKLLKWLVILVILGLAALWFTFSTPDLPKELLEDRYTNDASAFLQLPSGTRAHYRLYGPKDAPKLVLLHGSNASLHTWEPWVERLKGAYHLLTIDLPGHGLTGPTPLDDYSQQAMADMVKELVTALGWADFTLGGNSMGGGVSLAYALQYPGDINALILVDATGVDADQRPGSKKPSLPIAFRIAGTWYGDLIFTNITPRSLVIDGLQSSISVKSVITKDMIDRYHDLARYPGARLATSKRFQGYREGKRELDVARITKPALILWGSEDGLIPVQAGEKMDRLMPNSRLVILPETGHIPMEERPDKTAALVADFLRDNQDQ